MIIPSIELTEASVDELLYLNKLVNEELVKRRKVKVKGK
jgi:hypothetical protein